MQRQYTVGEFKARFSEALHAVEQGDTVAITYGRAKRTVAMLTPPPKPEAKRVNSGAMRESLPHASARTGKSTKRTFSTREPVARHLCTAVGTA